MGRFISEDPIGFGGGINFYSYVGNRPIQLADPSGLVFPGFNYCGPGNNVGNPLNPTDVHCAVHDLCYDDIGASAGGRDFTDPRVIACDQQLIGGLRAAQSSCRSPYEYLVNIGAQQFFTPYYLLDPNKVQVNVFIYRFNPPF